MGQLSEGDGVSLSAGLGVAGCVLLDDANGARHRLHPRAAEALRSLHTPQSYSAWMQNCKVQGLQTEDVAALLRFLYTIGGLHIRQGLKSRGTLLVFRLRLLAYGCGWHPPVRRWPLGPLAIVQGVTRASSLFGLLVPLTVLALCWAGLPVPLACGYAGGSYAIFWISTMVHEGVHAVLAAGDGSAVVLQRGLRLGILHKPGRRRREVVSALCGPLAGGAVAVLLGLLASWPYLWAVGLFMAVAHLWSLVPWYGDGEVLWKTGSKRR